MILVKTERGQQVLRDRSVRLTPRQRSAFILFDGRRSVPEVLAAGMGVTQEDIDQLLGRGLLGRLAEDAVASSSPELDAPRSSVVAMGREAGDLRAPVGAQVEPPSGRSAQERYKEAYPIATQLTASLGLRGFRLNLAVEAATSFEELAALAPKIRAAVGPEKAMPLERALMR